MALLRTNVFDASVGMPKQKWGYFRQSLCQVSLSSGSIRKQGTLFKSYNLHHCVPQGKPLSPEDRGRALIKIRANILAPGDEGLLIASAPL